MKSIKQSTFQCENCGGVFEYDANDEASVRAEQEQNGWGDMPDDDMAIICDNCYQELFGWINGG